MDSPDTTSGGSVKEEDILLGVLDTAMAIAGADFGNVQLLDPRTSRLRIVADRGFPRFWVDFWNQPPSGKGSCGKALHDRSQTVIEDITRSPIFVGTDELDMQLKAGVLAVTSTPMTGRSGELIGMFSIHYKRPTRPTPHMLRHLQVLASLAADAIEQSQTLAKLSESEARFRALVTAGPNVVYCASPDWTEVHQLHGDAYLAEMNAPGRTWLEKFIFPEDQPEVLAAVDAAVAGKRILEMEHRVRRVDGTVGWMFSRAVPIQDADGRIREWFGVAVDLTERRQVEEKLVQSQIEQQLLVQERELRERFVSMLSHDLRTPLAVARMSAEIIARGTEDRPEMHSMAERAARSVTRALRMIDDLLDANRINAGEALTLDVRPCDLVEVTMDTVTELKSLFGDRFLLLAPDHLEGNWDSHAFQRILENLCTNAVKYGSTDKITISLQDACDHVNLAVHNEGPTISPGDQAAIFGLFQRVDGPSASVQQGWGLGLTIVQGLAWAMGGTVGVESQLGRGSTFTVQLPRDAHAGLTAI